ncbi:HAD family hydrolase [Anaeromicropila herbilytica]|uniref:Haloacid dehalogenase n=1 Tax=Anaeromicropila herbilytica TaxID=2785025 RepID=A0A7R7EMF4_9FIRM|nr:HAD family hydrolase [Anaeromicropila herbilytica]BCN31454.1 haloacid dehalogenase [Anaeromicropila herbilytica]
MIKLVIADMDGTLLNSRHELSDRLFPTIKKLKEKGVRFAVASGRQYYNLYSIFEEIKDDIYFLCENGTIAFYRDEKIYINEIEYSTLEKYVKEIRSIDGAYPILCGEKAAYIEDSDEEFLDNTKLYYKKYEKVDDILEAAKQDKICKIAVYDRIDAESNSYERLKQYNDRNMIVLSGKAWVDIMNLNANKGQAIQTLQKQFGITREESMAFGDYLNDYEMMQACHYSYAMANAHERLKVICNYEAKSNDEDGVVEKLIEVFNLEL